MTTQIHGKVSHTRQLPGSKKINKMIKDDGPKGVQSQIQGDQLRVTGKKRDDLQEVIAMLKKADLDVPLQFTNYR